MDVLIYGVPPIPIAGFVLGLRRAWKWSWIGAAAAVYFEARRIQVEGSWGSFATGQDSAAG